MVECPECGRTFVRIATHKCKGRERPKKERLKERPKKEIEYRNDETLPFEPNIYVKYQSPQEKELIERLRDDMLEKSKLIETRLKTMYKFTWFNFFNENEILEYKSSKDNAV